MLNINKINMLILAKNSSKTEIKVFPWCTVHIKTRISLKYFLNYFSFLFIKSFFLKNHEISLETTMI